MSWVNLMQSTPSHLCPESIWCSSHLHTYVLSQSDAVHTQTLMFWISLMQSTPSYLCSESVWCSPLPHTYVLSQSNAVHTLILMSWVSLMQSTPKHLCLESVWCSPHPHTYDLRQSDAVHTFTLMSWDCLMQSRSPHSVSWLSLCPDLQVFPPFLCWRVSSKQVLAFCRLHMRVTCSVHLFLNILISYINAKFHMKLLKQFQDCHKSKGTSSVEQFWRSWISHFSSRNSSLFMK